MATYVRMSNSATTEDHGSRFLIKLRTVIWAKKHRFISHFILNLKKWPKPTNNLSALVLPLNHVNMGGLCTGGEKFEN